MRKIALSHEEALQIFELDYGASQEEIKRKFRELVKNKHPDLFPEEQRKEAEEMYKWISYAYEILNETQKPGRVESPGFLRGRPKPQGKPFFDPSTIQTVLKKWVAEMAKDFGGKPVKRPNDDRWFAIRLSEWVGIGIFFGKVLGINMHIVPEFYLISLGDVNSWKDLGGPGPFYGRAMSFTEIPVDWDAKIDHLYRHWEKNSDRYEKLAGKPTQHDPSTLIKKWVEEQARIYKTTPIQKPGKDLQFAIPLTKWVGIEIFFEKFNQQFTPNFSLVSLTSWEILFEGTSGKVWYSNDPNISNRIPSEWDKKVSSLHRIWNVRGSEYYDTLAGKKVQSPPSQNEQDIAFIESIPGWETINYLIGQIRLLKKGYPILLPKTREVIKDWKSLLTFEEKFPLRAKTVSDFINALHSRLDRGKPLTPIQKAKLNTLIQSNGQPKKRGRPPKSQSGQSDPSNPSRGNLLNTLKNERAYPDSKDLMRIKTIYLKSDPIREAKNQAAKITDKSKALRRAKAALQVPYTINGREFKVTSESVALIFYRRYLEL